MIVYERPSSFIIDSGVAIALGADGGDIPRSVAALIAAVAAAAATAAVLADRVVQLGVPALLGALASLDLRRLIRTGPKPEEIAARHADDPRITELS